LNPGVTYLDWKRSSFSIKVCSFSGLQSPRWSFSNKTFLSLIVQSQYVSWLPHCKSRKLKCGSQVQLGSQLDLIIIALEERGKGFFFNKLTTSTGIHVSTNRMIIILNYHERHTKGRGKEYRCKIQVISVYNKIIAPYFAVKQLMPPASIWKKLSVLVHQYSKKEMIANSMLCSLQYLGNCLL